jgi:phosphatidylserine decarboxylase
MTIHREGYPTIAFVSLVCIVLAYLTNHYLTPVSLLLSGLSYSVITGFWLFILSFFRIPSRTHTFNDQAVISPADGKVVVIEETHDSEYFNEKRLQISVFMSPANVHQNRYPVSGKVVYSQYHKGKYLVAWDPKSSTENERHSVVVSNEKTSLLVKQIAGAVARRIVNYAQPGKQVEQNEEMGFIKFGSRVDLLLPLDAKPTVKIGDKVLNGVTILATLP